jgi:hypothetical protein
MGAFYFWFCRRQCHPERREGALSLPEYSTTDLRRFFASLRITHPIGEGGK